MSTVQEIEEAVKSLPREDYGRFVRWLEDYDAEQFLTESGKLVAQMLDEEDGGGSQLVEDEG